MAFQERLVVIAVVVTVAVVIVAVVIVAVKAVVSTLQLHTHQKGLAAAKVVVVIVAVVAVVVPAQQLCDTCVGNTNLQPSTAKTNLRSQST